METVISALIGGAFSLIVCLLTNKAQHDKTVALVAYRLEQLEKEVQKHNSIVERTYSLEQRTAIQEEQIKVANHRLEDLERR